MDPNENIKRQRALAAEIPASDDLATTQQLADELAELVLALDEWLSKGGFSPSDWQTLCEETI